MEKKNPIEDLVTEEEYMKQAANQVLDAAMTPGAAIPVDPDVADYMGAFEEKALSDEDAEDASFDGEIAG